MIDWTALNPTAAWAAGGVVSTIGDLHIWLQALIDGSLISTELQRERLVERDPGEPSYGYGLGLGLGLTNYDGVSVMMARSLDITASPVMFRKPAPRSSSSPALTRP